MPKSSLQDLSRSKNLKITKVAGSRLATVVRVMASWLAR